MTTATAKRTEGAAMTDHDRAGVAARLRCESGLGVVEVLVAALLLTLGALATFGLLDTAKRQTFRAEQSQVISDRLQAEMEAIKRLEYARVALTRTPTHSDDPGNPNYRVSNYGGYSTFALNENGTNSATLVVNGTDSTTEGVVDPGPTPFSSGDLGPSSDGDIEGQIYRYVTWINDPSCPETICPGARDMKRVTIAIQADAVAPGGERAYQEIHSDVVDGNISQVEGQPVPPPAKAEAIPYTLSDTTCDRNSRVEPSSHETHNTLGSCAPGVAPA